MRFNPSRRDVLKAGAAVALPMLGASPSARATTDTPAFAPTVGVSTLGFPNHTNQELARELTANGVDAIQLFLVQQDSKYWVYNGRNDVSALDAARCSAIADIYRSSGISIHSIGVYTNLVHADAEEREANLAYFEEMFRIGAAMDVRTLVTEAGHYEVDALGHGVPHYFREEVWRQMVDTGRELAAMAERHDGVVLFEPFYRGFFASAKRTRLFLEAVDSPRIRALLDPANLIELNDLGEMFAQLAPYIDCLHAKDRKLHVDRGVAAGQGDLDYNEFVALAARYVPHAPFILEYVGLDDYKPALALLQKAVRHYNTGVS